MDLEVYTSIQILLDKNISTLPESSQKGTDCQRGERKYIWCRESHTYKQILF